MFYEKKNLFNKKSNFSDQTIKSFSKTVFDAKKLSSSSLYSKNSARVFSALAPRAPLLIPPSITVVQTLIYHTLDNLIAVNTIFWKLSIKPLIF